jgi:competence protein ComEC
MRPEPPPAIVAVAASLILGAACGGARPHLPVALGSGLAGLLASWLARRTHRRIAQLALIVAAWSAGAAAQRYAWHEQTLVEQQLFQGRPRIERELIARVLAGPERTADGTRRLRVEALLPPDGRIARLELEIASPAIDDRARLLSLRHGDLVLAWCTLGAPRGGPLGSERRERERLAAQRLVAYGRVKSSRLVLRLRRGDPSLGRTIDALHVAAVTQLDRALDPDGPTRAVLGAMVLGDRGLLGDDVQALLRDAGLVHLISISGLHTAMTLLVLFALLRGAGLRPAGLALGGVVALPALAALVGDGASVLRACGCLAVVLVARAAGREIDGLGALALSAGALVLTFPGLAWNAGFLLSVVATAGLIVAMRRATGALAQSCAATTGAYAATLPLGAHVFGRAAPVALLANLVAAPLCAGCLVTGVAIIVGAGIPGAAPALAWAGERAVSALIAASRCAASIPGGHMRVADPPLTLCLAYILALAVDAWLGLAWPRAARRIAALAATFLGIAIQLGPPPPGLVCPTVAIVNVGQGLSVLLQGAAGAVSLYDAGPGGAGRVDSGDRIVVPRLASLGCRRLEVLALSHDHDDHAGGAFAVIRDCDVGELWLAAGSEHDPLAHELAAAAVARGVAVRRLHRGTMLVAGGWRFEVLHPGLEDRRRPLNDRCLALRVRPEGSDASVLLPGDIEAAGEQALLRSDASLAADALVAPHHGSEGSSTTPFVEAVGARDVLISVGEGNRFGHPAPGAVRRLGAAGASVWRTDRDGTVTLTDSGGRWRVSVQDDRRRDE